MHTYERIMKQGKETWTVGFFVTDPQAPSEFVPLKEFDDEINAARFVNYLNGGEGELKPFIPGLVK